MMLIFELTSNCLFFYRSEASFVFYEHRKAVADTVNGILTEESIQSKLIMGLSSKLNGTFW
jgi:hypothetical protein